MCTSLEIRLSALSAWSLVVASKCRTKKAKRPRSGDVLKVGSFVICHYLGLVHTWARSVLQKKASRSLLQINVGDSLHFQLTDGTGGASLAAGRAHHGVAAREQHALYRRVEADLALVHACETRACRVRLGPGVCSLGTDGVFQSSDSLLQGRDAEQGLQAGRKRHSVHTPCVCVCVCVADHVSRILPNFRILSAGIVM